MKREAGTVVFSLVIFALLVFALGAVGRNTLAQIVSVKSGLALFAEGDFNSKIEVRGNDEFTMIQKSMVEVQKNMKSTLDQLNDSIESAKAGDLTQRVSMDNQKGIYRTISQSVNELIEISENVVNDTTRIFAALAEGRLNERIEQNYQGSFDKLKHDANTTLDRIDQVINVELQSLVDAASNGDLAQRIPLDDKSGFYKTLSTGLNTMVDSVERLFGDMGRVLEALAHGNLTQPITADYPAVLIH